MAHFRIVYDGKALENSEMDIHELAPALLSIGDLLESASNVIYGSSMKPQTKVVGSFKTGCFGIDFSFVGSFVDTLTELLTSKETVATTTLLEIIGFTKSSIFSLIWVIRKLNKRNPTQIIQEKDSVTLYVDGENIKIELDVYKLIKNPQVRKNLAGVLSPLKHEGIDVVHFVNENNETVETIQKHEIEMFSEPQIEDVEIQSTTSVMAFSIISLAFKEDNKWRLTDGNQTISANVQDEEFLRKVDNNLSFSKGDILVCDVKIEQWQTSKGVRTEYTVTKVIEHKPALQQMSLF